MSEVVPVAFLACGVWWLSGKFGALRLQGHRFESHSIRHVGALGKCFTTVACSALVC